MLEHLIFFSGTFESFTSSGEHGWVCINVEDKGIIDQIKSSPIGQTI